MNTQTSYFKKVLVVLMAVMMVFTMMPSLAWATEDTVGSEAQQEEPASTPTFKGTATHGYVKDISFSGKAERNPDEAVDPGIGYSFDSDTTEYALEYPDNLGMYIQWQANSGFLALGLRTAVAYYDESTKTWIGSGSLETWDQAINGYSLGGIGENYDRPSIIRVAMGPTGQDGTVDLEQADIYYYSITRKAMLDGINAGTDYPLSPAFDKYGNTTTYSVYGSFTDDTEISLTLKTGSSKVAVLNKVYANGVEADGTASSRTFSAKYLELWSDTDGRKYVNIEVAHPSTDGETQIPGETYKVYFLNEQKVNFTTQPVGGTFSPQAGKTTTLSVEVTVPEDAKIAYKWVASNYNAKTNRWTAFNQAILNGKADKSTWNTPNLPVKLNSAMHIRCYCQVTLTIDGIDYVANSNIAEVIVKTDEKVSGPNLLDSSVLIPRTYYQGEDTAQLIAHFSPIDAGAVTTMQWYVSKQADGSNPEKLPTEPIKGGNAAADLGLDGAVTPDTSKVGTFYYYCVGTSSLEEDGQTYSADTRSEIVEIEVKPIVVDLKGDGSKENPYLIESYADLVKIKDAVNNDGVTFANRYLELTAEEITLPADWKGLGRNDESKWAPYVSGLMPFSGNLDGCGHLIKMDPGCKGLIEIARDAVVKDLDLYGEEITASALLTNCVVDYGLDRQYSSGCPSPITADNVTLKSGSRTKQSGLIGGGGGSGQNKIFIRNCTVEEGVIVGYDKEESSIGSFIGSLNGVIINSTSAADVFGAGSVGGLVGQKGQSMGPCQVLNSSFTGSITATGQEVGGIMGNGYESDSAPNSPVVSIINCYVEADIIGKDKIGGIFGSEGGVIDCWDNGVGSIDNNSFYGTITATKADAKYVGGIVGYLRSFNKNQGIDTNYYLDTCGTDKGVGMIQKVHTTGTNAVEKDFDVEKHCTKASAEAFKDGTVLKGLQAGKRSYKNWIQGETYPVHSGETVLYAIELSGDYKTEYKTGEKLDTDGMIITGKLSDGSTRTIALSDENLKFTGFQSNQRGVQTITITYGVAKTTYEIRVLYNDSQVREFTAHFRLLGDSDHTEPTEAGGPHTLAAGNLTTWIPRTKVTINNNMTVYDVFSQVLTQNGIKWDGSANNQYSTMYISGIRIPGSDVTLSELTNGPNSGWMYTLNGVHPNLGVAQQFLNSGDEIIFHYTDDWTKETDTKGWLNPEDEVKDVTTDVKAGTTTAPTEVKVSEKTAADGTKEKVAEVKVTADDQKEILKQAKDNKVKEIILVVSKDDVKDATKADVILDKSFLESIVKDTGAKLTIKTPFGDKTYTQDELKALIAAASGSTITLTIEKSDELDEAAKLEKAKELTASLALTARSAKTAKKNVKVSLKMTKASAASIKEIQDLGYIVKYKFYRSTKKASKYAAKLTKTSKTYLNTSGAKGSKYYYKARVMVYDESGKLVTYSKLTQCKYAARTWNKAK